MRDYSKSTFTLKHLKNFYIERTFNFIIIKKKIETKRRLDSMQ
ncbi:unnamed protein product [Phyllotreta striolata]|uniref:Uncharacterized protein n=1 Tax=Phyllotreta striolata TaxID=444603 RepID=A0A9N9XJ16_PHYSR|nr:unnamed protein product [Phyllotreta striolata]